MTTTLAAAVKALFNGDTTFKALATFIYDAEALGRPGLELQDVQSAGVPLVQPTLYIRWTTEAPYSGLALQARQVFCELYFYQHAGYDTIRKMRQRAFELLHQQRVSFNDPGGDYLFAFYWAGDVREQVDDSLAGASFERSRYEGILTRD